MSCSSYVHKKNEILLIFLGLVRLQDARLYPRLELKVTKFEMDMINLNFTNTDLQCLNIVYWKPYRDSFRKRIQWSTMYFHSIFFILHTGQKNNQVREIRQELSQTTSTKNFPKSKLPTNLALVGIKCPQKEEIFWVFPRFCEEEYYFSTFHGSCPCWLVMSGKPQVR